MRSWIIALTLLLVSRASANVSVTYIRIGVILGTGNDAPHDIERSGAAVDLAVRKVNIEILNSSYSLMVIKKTFTGGCDATLAPGYAADLVYADGVAAFVGPGCTYALDPVARLSGYWNIPIITGLGDSGRFKDKTDFQTLTRYSYCQCRLRKVFGSLFLYHNWTDISVIIDRDHEQSLILGETLDVGLQRGGYLPNIIKYYSNSNPDYKEILKQASEVSRVMVLSVHGDDVRKLLVTAYDLGYPQTGEYVFVDVELIPLKGSYYGNHHWSRGDDDDWKARIAFESLLRIGLYMPTGQLYTDFAKQVKADSKRYYNFDYDARGEEVNFFVGATYDSIVHYGRIVNKTLDLYDMAAVKDGYNMARRLWDQTFQGVTGNVFLDNNGDRDTNFKIMDMDPSTGEFQIIAYFWGNKPGFSPDPNKSIHWGGGRTEPPPNEPRCFFKGNNPACIETKPIQPAIIALIAILCVVVVTAVVGFLGYRKYKENAMLRDMSWLISRDEVKKRKTSITSFSMLSLGSCKSDPELGDQMFGIVGWYKQGPVSLRESHIKLTAINKDLLVEVHKRLGLQHNNVVRFIGVVMEPKVIELLHEYCPKGSLQDILLNDSINLDADFRRSLIDDVVRGMCYIHNSDVHYHGRLRSTNCVVDGRFVLKLTDFGLPTFYDDSGKGEDENIYYQKLLWRAPEQLAHGKLSKCSAKGDVYSFAIVLQEIVARAMPFEVERETLSPKDIVARLETGGTEPFRPQLPKECQPELVTVIKYCWDEDPNNRPSMEKVKAQLAAIFKRKAGNLMDNLLMRMEQYANNLEHIVADRTGQLMQEQRKTEQLLLQILPKSIAEQLKYGQSVQPETYDCVTIYFSDIVGFTTISAGSTPLEVVAMLNDLYIAFDSTIEKFDVYKVETIGDAYMVVSGLPIRNDERHASEIAAMSLDLLKAIDKFKIHHRPDEKLRLRIGLHSGSCVAGVVGLKMPRYCLFGDTVNTASRMESNGLPLMIHMSESITHILKKNGGFVIIAREQIEVKGKGIMQTYWLNGRRALNVNITDISSQHSAGPDPHAMPNHDKPLLSNDALAKMTLTSNRQLLSPIHSNHTLYQND